MGQALRQSHAALEVAPAKGRLAYLCDALLKHQFRGGIVIPWSRRAPSTALNLNIFVIPHGPGTGNGQNTIAIDAPGQVVATLARSHRTGRLNMECCIQQRFIAGCNVGFFPPGLTSCVIYIRQLSTAAECLRLDFCHPPWDRHTGQAAAVSESAVKNARHAVRYLHAGQAAAGFKRAGVNICHALRNRHASQIFAAGKSISPDFRHALGHCIGSALLSCRVAKQERMILIEQNIVHRIVGCISVHNNAAQTAATRKSSTADILHAFGNRHTGQAFAAQKSAPSNACQITGQSQAACKTVAVKERRSVDTRQAFRKHQTARKTMTIFKSASADTG